MAFEVNLVIGDSKYRKGNREVKLEGRKRRNPINLLTLGLDPPGNVHQQISWVATYIIRWIFIHNITTWNPNLGILFLEEYKVLGVSSGFHRYPHKSQRRAIMLSARRHFQRLMSKQKNKEEKISMCNANTMWLTESSHLFDLFPVVVLAFFLLTKQYAAF